MVPAGESLGRVSRPTGDLQAACAPSGLEAPTYDQSALTGTAQRRSPNGFVSGPV